MNINFLKGLLPFINEGYASEDIFGPKMICEAYP